MRFSVLILLLYLYLTLSLTFSWPTVSFHAVAPEKFRIAVMYSEVRSDDIKCAVKAAAPQLEKLYSDVEIQTIAYPSNPADLKTTSMKILKENYDVVIGPMISHEIQIVAQVLIEKQTPLFLPVASNPELTKLFPATIRMLSTSDHYAQLAAAHAIRSQKTSNILIISNQSLPYSKDYAREFIKQLRLRDFKGQITEYKYLLGQNNFKIIPKILSDSKINFIYAPIYAEDISSLYLTVSDAKISTKIFTHAGIFNAQPTLLAHYDPKILIQFHGIWDQRVKGEHNERFIKIIEKSCGLARTKPWTMAVWDAINLTIATHMKHPSLRALDFVGAVRKMAFTGILGKWELGEDNEPIRSLPIYSLTPTGAQLDLVVSSDETRVHGGKN